MSIEDLKKSVQEGTVKVNAARAYAHMSIVWTAWLLESMAIWKRLDEEPFSIAQGASDDNPYTEDRLGELSMDVLSPPHESQDDVEVQEVVDVDPAEDINWDDADAELDAFLMESGMFISDSYIYR